MVIMLSLAACGAARAQGDAVYRVTYCETALSEQASGARLLAAARDAGRHAAGNLRFDLLREAARPNRFVLVEVWQDQAALDGNDGTPSTTEFREKLKAVQAAPCDPRLLGALRAWDAKREDQPGTVHVVTHVDVTPQFADDAASLLDAMFDSTTKEDGNLGYDVLRQTNRKNHFTVVETWAGMKAFEAHVMGAHTREFRTKLSPMIGALYDERIYAMSAD
jgi:quinol monooxygenase YgiN